MIDGQSMCDQISSDQGANVSDQIAFCAFHSFLVGSPNERWLHTCDACVLTTWRLEMWAPLFAHN